MQPTPDTITTTDELLELVAAGAGASDAPGDDGEAVDLLEHALQCAHELSLRRPGDDELAVAGLLHDIGHQLVPGDDPGHGRAAAECVRGLLGTRVADLIDLHVPAKRFLVATEPTYNAQLSTVSIRTLGNQGGLMTVAEAQAFARLPHWDDALELRRADDAAKVPGKAVPSLETWKVVVEAVAAAHRERAANHG